MRPGRRIALPIMLLLSTGLSVAGSTNFAWGFRQDGFRFEAILSLAARDLDDDGRAELVLAGRNYLDKEACLEILRWENKNFTPIWRSPNLIESESTLLGLTVTRPDGPAVVALTRTTYRIYRHRGGVYAEEARGVLGFTADEEAASGDLDGDGCDELIVAETLRNTKAGREKALRTLTWREGRFVAGPPSEAVGNIRALAAGDLDGDGHAEVVVDTGVTTGTGSFRVFRWTSGVLRQSASRVEPMPSASYGLSIGRQFPEPGQALIAACQPGRVRSFRLFTGGLTPAETDLSFSGSPVSLTIGDLDGDRREEVILAGYPARLQVLLPTAPHIRLSVDGVAQTPREPLRRLDGVVIGELRAVTAILGWELAVMTGRHEISFKGRDGQPHSLVISDGAAPTAVLDGTPVAITSGARTYAGFLYLPIEQLVKLAGYETSWDEGQLSLSLRRGSSP